MQLTEQQLAELKALEAAATPGPWHAGDWGVVYSEDRRIAVTYGPSGNEKRANRDFIALSRTAIRALLADLEEVKEELDEWRFTNKVDELCRRVDHAESELAATRQQLSAYECDDGQPTELEMHRADYKACNAAGFESSGELLSAYKTLEKQLADTQNALLAARNSKEHYQESWSEVCNENQSLRNQLAEAQASSRKQFEAIRSLEKFASAVASNSSYWEEVWPMFEDVMCATEDEALQSAIATAVEPHKRDAERYRWLQENCLRAVTIAADAIAITDSTIDAALSAKEAT